MSASESSSGRISSPPCCAPPHCGGSPCAGRASRAGCSSCARSSSCAARGCGAGAGCGVWAPGTPMPQSRLMPMVSSLVFMSPPFALSPFISLELKGSRYRVFLPFRGVPYSPWFSLRPDVRLRMSPSAVSGRLRVTCRRPPESAGSGPSCAPSRKFSRCAPRRR